LDNYLDLSKYQKSSLGVTVDHSEEFLKVDYKYTLTGWFFLTWFGTTRMPTEVKFTCKQSGEVFEVLHDKKLIEHYMLYRRK
jgi:hypothetical protein